MKAKPLPPPKVALGIRLRPDLKEAAEEVAAAEHRSLSSWVELAIMQALQGKKR